MNFVYFIGIGAPFWSGFWPHSSIFRSFPISWSLTKTGPLDILLPDSLIQHFALDNLWEFLWSCSLTTTSFWPFTVYKAIKGKFSTLQLWKLKKIEENKGSDCPLKKDYSVANCKKVKQISKGKEWINLVLLKKFISATAELEKKKFNQRSDHSRTAAINWGLPVFQDHQKVLWTHQEKNKQRE